MASLYPPLTRMSGIMGDIGRYLAISHPGDTLFLEPAGQIPFFPGLFTDDEVGLVSPRVIAYHRQFPHDWWPHFVEDNQPTFIVERSPMLTGWTYHGYRLNPAERTWFTEHYCAMKCFSLRPDDLLQQSILEPSLNPVPESRRRLGPDTEIPPLHAPLENAFKTGMQ